MKKDFRYVNKPVRKKDAMQLLTGKPVFTDDITPDDCLVVKVVRSPYPNALISGIDVSKAMMVPGIEVVYTYKDVPQKRFTMAGQTFPEPSPRDRLILDRHVRYVGDPVAIVAGETEEAVDRAMKLVRVEYEVLEPLMDPEKALDSHILVHPEDSWNAPCPVGADNRRNLCAQGCDESGSLEEVFSQCDHVIERKFHTLANQQAMMETFRTYCEIDTYGRLHVIGSTQVVFHARRILSNAIGIPQSKIRVEKPRIGGGFGAKQTLVAEIYPAFVTWMTGKPSKMIYSRKETLTASSPRHEMILTVKVGAMNDGTIRGMSVHTLSNTGAYGEHGPTTVGLSGHKSIPLYTNNLEAFRFSYDVVYTNRMSAGAYRGYGATQGIFAVESTVNELADIIGMDPVEIREKNMVREGQKMDAYYGETATSCTLDRCMTRCAEMFNWKEKFKVRDMGDGKVRTAGVAMAMQGSGISSVDVGSANIKLEHDGYYTLSIGAADMGTGCDTVLAQMAAERLMCSIDKISVFGADTDASPYDSGSYASSTTYVTGTAVLKACDLLVENMKKIAAGIMECTAEELEFDGEFITSMKTGAKVTPDDVAVKSMCGNTVPVQVTCSHSSPKSPPPFMVGMAEVEVDRKTGNVELLDYCAVVDCGTAINMNLARVQTEGGLAQGIGMALFENVQYDTYGRVKENSFMQYKIPARTDVGRIRVEFEESYEESGPYGAKSLGEVVINTPSPAIAHAVARATGVWHRELPITPEKVLMGMRHVK